jgi:hypothetical protein
MINKFKKIFGKPEDVVICAGDFEQKQHMKYKEPIKGKGIRKLFRENDYKVYLVDEFRTSCMCSKCKINTAKCEKFMIRKNPKPYKEGNILVHGLLKCKICGSVWNRDVNASTNIYRIAMNAINKVDRPKYLCRDKIDDNKKELDEKPKKKKKIKHNNSVGVDASTKS